MAISVNLVFKGNSLNRLIFLRDFILKEKIAFDTFKQIRLNKNHTDFKNYGKFLNQSKNKQLSFYQLKKLIRKNMLKGPISKGRCA